MCDAVQEPYMTAVKLRIQLIWKIENLSDLRFKIYIRRIDVYNPTIAQL